MADRTDYPLLIELRNTLTILKFKDFQCRSYKTAYLPRERRPF